MADKKYKGWIEDKKEWQEFEASHPTDAMPSASGYDRVIDLDTDEEIYG